MGIGDLDLMDDAEKPCSICLDIVSDHGDRSWAKLHCGHLFHLDCIGSAFNVKGAMQCPNCRKIEKGQWLYSNGSRPYAEFNMEDWAHDEDLYDLSHSEMSFGVHWCPFSGLTRLPSSFDEGELSPTTYHDLLGQHAVIAEHTAVSSGSHHCPYVAYFGPFPSSSNSSGSVSDGAAYSSHWNSRSAPTSSHVPAPDQPPIPSMTQRAARNNFDNLRSGSFGYPFAVGHGSNARAGSSIAASMLPPYPGSAARARDRAQALQAYFQHPPGNSQGSRTPGIPSTRRASSHRNMAQGEPVASSSDQASGFYFFPSSSSAGRNFVEAENSMPNRFHAWERDQFPSFPSSQAERDPIWGPIHQLPGAPETGVRPASFRQRHGSERMQSQHRS
ncbi:E3 ubiquitin-protein ligase RFWD3 [Heracleum sosnowskyi]|uniref:E3 ubiquitin-protein ligase RFWD3 n=1 Tax=Heracleum sosnowskyi TaxID=360622 RepID=A0AAD8MX41_9APIA|nr:E3 ubiquitin-protein ligase RFWD3 [Heracleum sosnowskyi]